METTNNQTNPSFELVGDHWEVIFPDGSRRLAIGQEVALYKAFKEKENSLLRTNEQLIDAQLDKGDCLSALQLIASPKRPDGTYNRNREACEKLADETIKKMRIK